MSLRLILTTGVIKMTQASNINARGQWLALNRIAYSYKVICFSLIGCLILTLSILTYIATLPPVVIVDKGESIERCCKQFKLNGKKQLDTTLRSSISKLLSSNN